MDVVLRNYPDEVPVETHGHRLRVYLDKEHHDWADIYVGEKGSLMINTSQPLTVEPLAANHIGVHPTSHVELMKRARADQERIMAREKIRETGPIPPTQQRHDRRP